MNVPLEHDNILTSKKTTETAGGGGAKIVKRVKKDVAREKNEQKYTAYKAICLHLNYICYGESLEITSGKLQKSFQDIYRMFSLAI